MATTTFPRRTRDQVPPMIHARTRESRRRRRCRRCQRSDHRRQLGVAEAGQGADAPSRTKERTRAGGSVARDGAVRSDHRRRRPFPMAEKMPAPMTARCRASPGGKRWRARFRPWTPSAPQGWLDVADALVLRSGTKRADDSTGPRRPDRPIRIESGLETRWTT